jgi:hypothetical protein
MLPEAEQAGLVFCSSAWEKPLLVDALASNVEKNIQFTKFIPARGQPSDDLREQFCGLLATTCCAALLTSN